MEILPLILHRGLVKDVIRDGERPPCNSIAKIIKPRATEIPIIFSLNSIPN